MNSKSSLDIIASLDDPQLFKPWFSGGTWDAWRVILKGIYALPISEEEKAFFRVVAERDPPKEPVKEVVIIAGRRGGKDSVASLIGAHSAASSATGQACDLASGASACDRDQAKIVLNYTRSYLTEIPLLQGMVQKETQYGFELTNSIDISVATNSFRSVRGRPILCAILDEVAYWVTITPPIPTRKFTMR